MTRSRQDGPAITIGDDLANRLRLIADAEDDALSLAEIGEVDPAEFRRFLEETAESDPAALEILHAAQVRADRRPVRAARLGALRLGDVAPDFTSQSTEGTIRFHEWLGSSWAVLFSHLKDFTPVCTTELGEVARLKSEFDRRNVKVIGISVDSTESHTRWVEDIEQMQGYALNFPLIADPDHKVSDLYDMIHPNTNDTLTVRSVFIIDPSKKIRLMLTYPASTGRNFNEILRVIDSLQLTDKHSVATPVNWKPGADVIIVPSLSDEDAKRKFPKGWRTTRPYFRIVPEPGKN